MQNIFIVCICFLSPIILNSQDRKSIKGQLLYKNTKVIAANVINNTSQMNTITDSDGFFEIDVALGDEIIFSSVQYRIKSVIITDDILKKNRLVVSVNDNINELKEVVVTTEDVEKFLDLKEEEFKGFDYEEDKSSKLINRAASNRQLSNGIDFVNIARLLARAIKNKTPEEQLKMKPSEILTLVFEPIFFEEDLGIQRSQINIFLEYIDKKMKTSKLLKKDKEFELIDYLVDQSELFKNIDQ
ncbi:MAG: hypothetical protein ACJ0PP_05690 [Flavobacteriaceae bacterium]